MKTIGTAVLVVGVFCSSHALALPTEEPPEPQAEAQTGDPQRAQGAVPRIFLDCQRCDFDYLRREVTFVNYVRDRRDAQVHVLVTTRSTGGGTEWSFGFIGLEEFEGTDITLEYNTSRTDTDDEVRTGYAQVLRIGVLNYLVDSPLAGQIEISYRAAAEEERQLMATPADDPWNFWVFRGSFETDWEGEQRQTERSISGSFSANRTTEEWKIRASSRGEFDTESFELSDGRTLTSDSQNYGASAQVVRSLGDHWGASVRGAFDSSTFENQDQAFSFAPGIEYNIFPYAESSRRQLTFTYEIGTSYVNYEEETIFDVVSETLFDETLLASYDVTQPWGESGLSVELAHFLDHPSQYRAEFRGDTEFRIFRGLSLEFSGEFSLVRDQRFLAKEGATDEEILLRRRALGTDYQYELTVGFSYTFGSIFNNVVNPRFAGRRGGGRFF